MRKPFMVEFTGTPEAGKTTSIECSCETLRSQGYQVSVSKESAESLPEDIPKGTPYANLWMHYRTQSSILKAQFSESDIVLIDRLKRNIKNSEHNSMRICSQIFLLLLQYRQKYQSKEEEEKED